LRVASGIWKQISITVLAAGSYATERTDVHDMNHIAVGIPARENKCRVSEPLQPFHYFERFSSPLNAAREHSLIGRAAILAAFAISLRVSGDTAA